MKLDFGCGAGGHQEISEDRLNCQSWCATYGGPDTYAIDYDPVKLELARLRIKNGTRFIQADGKQLPFPDNYFDIVHECAVLHHISGYQEAIAEIARVLKPGGLLLMKESVDNDPIFRLLRRVLGKWQGDDISSLFTSDELDRQLDRYFNITHREYYWRFTLSDVLRMVDREPQISLKFNQDFSRLFKRLGMERWTCSHYVVSAIRKPIPSILRNDLRELSGSMTLV
jgi:ubiquinone/menaquinone biosynthesis C-methylase UbiE